MTAAARLLADLKAAGVMAVADGVLLRLRPASAVPPDLLAEVRAFKSEVLALLNADGTATLPVLPSASPEQSAAEAADREAIAEFDGDAGSARWRLADQVSHAALLRGLQAASNWRPPSWPGANAVPAAGAWCSWCRGSQWLYDAEGASGWRCATCHPTVPGAAVVEVRS